MLALDRRTLLTGAAAALLAQRGALAAPSSGNRSRHPKPDLLPTSTRSSISSSSPDARQTSTASSSCGAAAWCSSDTTRATIRSATIAAGRGSSASPSRRSAAHELRSVTKSIVGLLYGIALGEGKVPALDAPLLAQFPQYVDLPDMAQRRRWTIRHAITMTLGTDWNEELSYDDPRNGQTAMEARARPLPLCAGAADRRRGGRALDLLRRRDRADRQDPGKRHRAIAARLRPRGAVRSARHRADREWRVGRDGERNFASGLAHAAARSRAHRADAARRRQGGRAPGRAGRVARGLLQAGRAASTIGANTAITGTSASLRSTA